jgi:hypothetical protein
MPATNPLRTSYSVMAYNSSVVLLLDSGNYPGQANYLNQTNTWNGTNWTVVSTQGNGIDPKGPLPCRINASGAFDGTNITIFGGEGQSETDGVLSDCWSYNGTSWSQIALTNGPFGRYKHQMAHLHTVGALMFGGCTVGNLLQESWLYNGTSFTQLFPATSPPARTNFAMAGSVASELILMYGGQGTNETFGDTWCWVGNSTGNWVRQAPTVQPPYMTSSAMAYDTAHNTFVMFGGDNGEGFGVPTTWVWSGGNGGNWTSYTMANGTGPGNRMGCQMAYDGTGVILIGGVGTASDIGADTWRWNGATNVWAKL